MLILTKKIKKTKKVNLKRRKFLNKAGKTLLSIGAMTFLPALAHAGNFDLRPKGASNPSFYIKSDGNVGIGTTSPYYGLSVNSPTGINSYNGVAGLGKFVLGDPSDPTGYVGMYRSLTGPANIGTAGLSLGLGSYSDMTFSLGASSFSGQTERMRILASNGNVGIGITNPSVIFQTGSATNRIGAEPRTDGMDIGGAGGTQSARLGGFYSTNPIPGAAIHFGAQGGAGQQGAIAFLTKTANDDTTQPSAKMAITSGGNVGIGTTVPASKLQVQGDGQNTSALNTASGLGATQIISDTGTTENYGGSVIFAAAGGAWRFAGIKGLLQNGSDNSLGDLSFSTRRISTDSTLTEALLIKYNGQVGIGISPDAPLTMAGSTSDATLLMHLTKPGTADHHLFFSTLAYSPNSLNTGYKVGSNATTSRSINAGGTINANGSDYAEYVTKSANCGVINKGDICGINKNGLLTDKFNESVSFVVKSTDPSFVGGDSWGAEGKVKKEDLETERSKVDRIAFCGQVPVNIKNVEPGMYIIPINKNGKITGKGTFKPTFEEYLICVGKVIAVNKGRPTIIVKVS